MFWIKTIKEIKEEIKLIKANNYLQKYQIKKLELNHKIWSKVLDNKLKEIEKQQQKGVKKKK